MKDQKIRKSVTCALVVLIGIAAGASHAQSRRPSVPQFEPDPLWSQLLPNNWVTGAVGGIAGVGGLPVDQTGLVDRDRGRGDDRLVRHLDAAHDITFTTRAAG